jgi:hypothetical protein
MKTGPDALGTAESESGSAKHEKGTPYPPYRRKHVRERKTSKLDPTPLLPPQMSPGAQNMKTGLDAPIPPKTCQGAQNMKMVPDALATVEIEYVHVKHENETRRPRNRRK